MWKRVTYWVGLFAALLLLFACQKPLFMWYNALKPLAVKDCAEVVWHGLSLDATVVGYLTALPLLALMASVWFKKFPLRKLLAPYWGVVALLLAVVFVVDTVLYSFWGFKLDATVFNYLDSPSEALASVSAGFVVLGGIAVAAVTAGLAYALIRSTPKCLPAVRYRLLGTALLLLMGGGLFVVIRGGVTESTANVGQVYYSEDQFLNHSAVNPCFSLLSSMGKNERFEDKYEFFEESRRAALFEGLYPVKNDSIVEKLLETPRPNVLIVLLEGFGSVFVESLGGVPGVSPNIDRLSREGVLFTNFYSNSFRTDRGTVCALSGYLGLPQTSVMKLPSKSRTLPSIAASLRKAGYQTDFLYGGDINFTNMKSYLLSTGYQRVTADVDFSLEERTSNAWGVNDDITFDHLYEVLSERKNSEPRWHTTFLTLSSHEPFEVPFNRFPEDKVLNSFAYTDDCLGRFIDRLKQLPQWEDMLVILLPDHGVAYAKGGIEYRSDARMYQAPMLWLGGAVKEPRRIDKLVNQTDLAATLLGQLGLPYDDFTFSRNVMGESYDYPFVFYAFNDGFGFRDSTGITVFSNESGKIIEDEPSPAPWRLQRGQAILQSVYDDLGSR